MFSKTMFQSLFDYHWHTTRRMMDCAVKLGEADFHSNPGYGRGSIHDLLLHLLRTDNSWRLALETGRQTSTVRPDDFPGLEQFQAGFKDEQVAWQALLDKSSAKEIEETIQLTSRRGDVYNIPRWRVMQHVVLHGMQHHAELAQLLTAKSQSPGDIDFIFFA